MKKWLSYSDYAAKNLKSENRLEPPLRNGEHTDMLINKYFYAGIYIQSAFERSPKNFRKKRRVSNYLRLIT